MFKTDATVRFGQILSANRTLRYGKFNEYMRWISVQTVHPPKMSKISKFRGWPWDGYSVVEDA